jgi:glycosyltransferase involved in cell wall biosynthesis
MQRRYPDQSADKFVTITNGFDPADLSEAYPDPRSFSIRHIGTLYAGRSVLPFLRGLEVALQREPDMKTHLRVEFLGDMDRLNQHDWDSFVNEHTLGPWVSRHPFVPRKQAVKLMQQTQVQVLILGKGQGIERIYPAKLFEYLGMQRPILAIASSGLAAALVNELEAGIVADPDQPSSIAEAILEFYARFQQGELQNWTTKGVQGYERRHLTGQLATVLDVVVAER